MNFKDLKWTRFASGGFEALGLKIVNDVIYTSGRDEMTRYHDLNNDETADHYEFNNDITSSQGSMNSCSICTRTRQATSIPSRPARYAAAARLSAAAAAYVGARRGFVEDRQVRREAHRGGYRFPRA